jgi:hypothetical protein
MSGNRYEGERTSWLIGAYILSESRDAAEELDRRFPVPPVDGLYGTPESILSGARAARIESDAVKITRLQALIDDVELALGVPLDDKNPSVEKQRHNLLAGVAGLRAELARAKHGAAERANRVPNIEIPEHLRAFGYAPGSPFGQLMAVIEAFNAEVSNGK